MLILQSPPGDFCPFLRVQDDTEGWQTREGRMKVRTEGGSTPRRPAIHFLQKSQGRMLASGVDLWWYPWQWVDRGSRCPWAAAGHDDFGIIGGRWSLGGGGIKKGHWKTTWNQKYPIGNLQEQNIPPSTCLLSSPSHLSAALVPVPLGLENCPLRQRYR